MDEDEERSVRDLLEQCSDHVALSELSSSSSTGSLDDHLLARFQRLKVAGHPPYHHHHRREADVQCEALNPPPRQEAASNPPDNVDADVLGADLASRLAALKKPNPQIHTLPNLEGTKPILGETCRTHGSSDDALEIEKLLQAAQDCVRLENSHASNDHYDLLSDEEVSDCDIQQIVEWAKDAATLEHHEEEEEGTEEEEREEEGGGRQLGPASVSTMPKASSTKTRGSRWKFW